MRCKAFWMKRGLPPELLELEMTESILLWGAEQAIEMIDRLRGMSITVAIDDFGTGFSSLSYLRDLPIHKIKLARAFVRDMPHHALSPRAQRFCAWRRPLKSDRVQAPRLCVAR